MSGARLGSALAGFAVVLMLAGSGCGGGSEGGSEAETPAVGDSCDPGDVVAVNKLPENLDCDQVEGVIVAEGDACDDAVPLPGETRSNPIVPTGIHLICDTSATVQVKGKTYAATPRLIPTPPSKPGGGPAPIPGEPGYVNPACPTGTCVVPVPINP